MKKWFVMLLVAALLTGAFACVAEEEGAEPRKIIIDTDTGADDASALILAAKSPEVQILGVTVLAGNVDLEQGTKNALAALELAGCDAPVYKGSDVRYDGDPIAPQSVFSHSFELIGSVIVAAYLLLCGVQTIRERLN